MGLLSHGTLSAGSTVAHSYQAHKRGPPTIFSGTSELPKPDKKSIDEQSHDLCFQTSHNMTQNRISKRSFHINNERGTFSKTPLSSSVSSYLALHSGVLYCLKAQTYKLRIRMRKCTICSCGDKSAHVNNHRGTFSQTPLSSLLSSSLPLLRRLLLSLKTKIYKLRIRKRKYTSVLIDMETKVSTSAITEEPSARHTSLRCPVLCHLM